MAFATIISHFTAAGTTATVSPNICQMNLTLIASAILFQLLEGVLLASLRRLKDWMAIPPKEGALSPLCFMQLFRVRTPELGPNKIDDQALPALPTPSSQSLSFCFLPA
ncbi:hypothetical protein H0G86_008166 [Trichoderma simmonsii]|uniref:Uncharacterized protein n=1 Tax=Trichoderma simmonsii TaxID=1491479 RepID=A0A8G0LGY7_9HYPO|nr:hypothetical protein H0G86_008166 [Trichoderma simmonsii]